MAPRLDRPRVALLSVPGSYAVDTLVAMGDFEFTSVDLDGLRTPPYTCPYGLPPRRSGDTLVVVSGWFDRVRSQGDDVACGVLSELRTRFRRLIGLDQLDAFRLAFHDAAMMQLDTVLKVNGVYRDPELYGYPVGAISRSGDWLSKEGNACWSYGTTNLDKVRLSVPCFVANVPRVRRRVRRLYGIAPHVRLARSVSERAISFLPRRMSISSPPPNTVHFRAAPTHPQRVDAVRLLRKSGLRWRGGITSKGDTVLGMSAGERDALLAELGADNLLVQRQNRLSYLLDMLSCKTVLSITGIGEVCFRMAEAWASRRVLVCQDLSHARMLFPLEAGRNVLFCRPDLSDLLDILTDVECNFSRYVDIAEQGYRDWQRWCTDTDHVLA